MKLWAAAAAAAARGIAAKFGAGGSHTRGGGGGGMGLLGKLAGGQFAVDVDAAPPAYPRGGDNADKAKKKAGGLAAMLQAGKGGAITGDKTNTAAQKNTTNREHEYEHERGSRAAVHAPREVRADGASARGSDDVASRFSSRRRRGHLHASATRHEDASRGRRRRAQLALRRVQRAGPGESQAPPR